MSLKRQGGDACPKEVAQTVEGGIIPAADSAIPTGQEDSGGDPALKAGKQASRGSHASATARHSNSGMVGMMPLPPPWAQAVAEATARSLPCSV